MTEYLSEDCTTIETSENAIGCIYPLGSQWMAHSVYKAKGVKRSTRQAAIEYLAGCA